MKRKQQQKDVLTAKRERLAVHTAQFESAVSLVTSTIDKLRAINEEINGEIQQIEDYQAELSMTRQNLDEAKGKNDRIIKNFSALLEV